jgi:hypothetical protein
MTGQKKPPFWQRLFKPKSKGLEGDDESFKGEAGRQNSTQPSQPSDAGSHEQPTNIHQDQDHSAESPTLDISSSVVNELDPWSQAYTSLRKDDTDGKLVKTYEKILTYRATLSTPSDGIIPEDTPNQFDNLSETERIQKMSEILQPVLDKAKEEKLWKTVAEQTDKLIAKIGKGVGDALQACQPAALAWSGICLLIPASVGDLPQYVELWDEN